MPEWKLEKWHNYLTIIGINKRYKKMVWNSTHFPAAMRSLNPSVRDKAIEIANSMLQQGGPDKKEVISTSISQARLWARRRFIESGGFN